MTTMETTTNEAASKFQLITDTALPHKCVSCGLDADGRRQFLDFNVSFDFEGALYICADSCGIEIARRLGFIPSTEIDLAIEDAAATVAGLQDELDAEKVKNLELTSRLAAFDFVSDDGSNIVLPASFSATLEELRDSVNERLGEFGTTIEGLRDSVSKSPDNGSD